MLKNTRNKLDGWLIIDKPYGIGSTDVVSKLKWSLSPQKIGHAGTLDPLASGVLPIALGHATKLIPFVMDGTKIYEFQVTWGCETETDDREGKITQTSANRPTENEIRNVLPSFTGTIQQTPPAYSAIKVGGQRAYKLARLGQDVLLSPRPVRIDDLTLTHCASDTADFRVVCGKGTYVRSLGRDIGRALGCFGYITSLRRVACGPFQVNQALPLSAFNDKVSDPTLLPLDTAIGHLPSLQLPDTETRRLIQGQRLPYQLVQKYTSSPLSEDTTVRLISKGHLLGLAQYRQGIIHPYRIFSD